MNVAFDEVLPELKNERGEHVEIVGPKITGPEALKWWVEQYRQRFREAFQTALDAGWQSDPTLPTPTSETLDDPPGEISPVARSNRGSITRPVQSIRGSLDEGRPSRHVLQSWPFGRSAGGFSGTFVGMLPTVDREVTEADVASGPRVLEEMTLTCTSPSRTCTFAAQQSHCYVANNCLLASNCVPWIHGQANRSVSN